MTTSYYISKYACFNSVANALRRIMIAEVPTIGNLLAWLCRFMHMTIYAPLWYLHSTMTTLPMTTLPITLPPYWSNRLGGIWEKQHLLNGWIPRPSPRADSFDESKCKQFKVHAGTSGKGSIDFNNYTGSSTSPVYKLPSTIGLHMPPKLPWMLRRTRVARQMQWESILQGCLHAWFD